MNKKTKQYLIFGFMAYIPKQVSQPCVRKHTQKERPSRNQNFKTLLVLSASKTGQQPGGEVLSKSVE